MVRDGGSEVYGRYFPDPGRPAAAPARPRPAVDTHTVQVRDAGARSPWTCRSPAAARSRSRPSDVEIGHTLAQLRTVELLAGAGMLALTGLLLTRVVSSALAPLGPDDHAGRPDRGRQPGRAAAPVHGPAPTWAGRRWRSTGCWTRWRPRAADAGFLADASHDLRTPVAGVIATADSLLRDDPDRAERERRLVAMVREARRAGRLVDDLLLMARLDGVDPGRALRRQPVDLAVLAQEVAAAQQLLGADVRAETEARPRSTGDPEQLARVLTNLADNGPPGRRPGAVRPPGGGPGRCRGDRRRPGRAAGRA